MIESVGEKTERSFYLAKTSWKILISIFFNFHISRHVRGWQGKTAASGGGDGDKGMRDSDPPSFPLEPIVVVIDVNITGKINSGQSREN